MSKKFTTLVGPTAQRPHNGKYAAKNATKLTKMAYKCQKNVVAVIIIQGCGVWSP